MTTKSTWDNDYNNVLLEGKTQEEEERGTYFPLPSATGTDRRGQMGEEKQPDTENNKEKKKKKNEVNTKSSFKGKICLIMMILIIN